MKRVLLTVAVALLIPSLAGAWIPTVGVYNAGKLHYTPVWDVSTSVQFEMELYIVQDELFVTAIEYALYVPDDPVGPPTPAYFAILGVTYPPNHVLEMGDVWLGHSITYWPPFTGYPTGYDLLCTYTCMTLVPCDDMWNYRLVVGPHPDTGELRGTYAPNAEFFDIIGLTTYICPYDIGVKEESWGAIKSMY